jgi:general secretion pathway protein G
MTRNNRGFTLIEVIVVAGIIAILAGILVPMIFSQIEEAKVSRAKADVKSIATALLAYRKDVGRWPSSDPTTNDPTPYYDTLWSDGIKGALDNTFVNVAQGNLSFHLGPSAATSVIYTAPGGALSKVWKGPYMNTFTADPWGNAYVVNVFQNLATDSVWVLSSGPNSAFETKATDQKIPDGSDDIGFLAK